MRLSAALIAAVVVVVVAFVVLVVVAPFEDDGEQGPTEVAVDAVVETPPLWYRKRVELTAPAVPLEGDRFLLEGEEQAIVVQPEPDAVEGEIEPGERVTVTGVVARLDRLQASELRPLLRGGRQPLLAEAPTALGGPYVSADRVDAA